MREDLAGGPPPAGFDPTAPWDWVIASSAYGRPGPLTLWWQEEVVMPLTLGHTSSFAGLAGGRGADSDRRPAAPAAPSSKRSRGNRGSSSGGGGGHGGGGGGAGSSSDVSAQICNSWNAGHGACSGDGACPAGRRHVCNVCPPRPGVSHRASHAHPKERKGRGKGKNKGKAKDEKPAAASQS